MSLIPKKNSNKTTDPFKSRKIFKNYLESFIHKINNKLDQNKKDITKEIEKVVNPETLKKTFQNLFVEKNEKIDELNKKVVDQEKDNIQTIARIKNQHNNELNELTQKANTFERLCHSNFEKFDEEKKKTKDLDKKLADSTSQLEKLNYFNEVHNNEIEHIKRLISNNENFINVIEKNIKKFQIVKTISYTLKGLTNLIVLRDIPAAREIITTEFEISLSIYISSLLIKFGFETEGFDKLLEGVNNNIPTYQIEYKDKEGSPMNSNEHIATDPHKNTFIEKYHTLPIKNIQFGDRPVKKAIIDAK